MLKSVLFRRLVVSFLLFSVSFLSYSTTITPVPSESNIMMDLVGRQLSEGLKEGYFAPDWKWNIEPGQIKSLKIKSQDISEDYCSYIVQIILQEQMCPTKYRAVVQVDYSYSNKKWRMVLVKSKGVSIVKTDKYLDCIRAEIVKYGFLNIKNNIDSPIIVGGCVFSNNRWTRFSVVLGGLEAKSLKPDYYSVEDYRIEFVELY